MPSILYSKVFREIGLADEQGSGMGNTYKYTKLYSGGSPEFIEGDVFHTVMPLAPITAEMVGPQDVTHVTLHDTLLERILVFERNCALKRGLCNTVVFRISNISRRSILNFC